jgi:putative DNA-invertase from lambdoid prophage Rac
VRQHRYLTYAESASQYSRARHRIGRRETLFLSSPFLAERDRIRNRISVVKKDQAQRGHYLGDIVPFGYTVNDDGALVEDAQQQAAIREMIVLKDKGKSLRTISEI